MPLYDLSIVLRTVPRAELVECMKKVGGVLYDHGAIVRGLEFLGHRNLPQLRALDHIDRSSVVKDGNYFIVSMDLPTKSIPTILENFSRNNDILTKVFIGVKDPKPVTCTLEEEFQTPVHRPSVKRMIEEGRPNKFKNVWTPRTGLGYYPFHR